MNYLSHYAVDHRLGDVYYNTALILPDVTKRWIKTFKHPLPPETFTPKQHALVAGSIRHYHSDAAFHASSFFAHYLDQVDRAVKQSGLSDAVNRKWFIAHILTELLIDRKIVHDAVHMCDSFYADLQLAEDSVLIPFLNFYGMADPEPFLQGFNHFRSVRYIYYYTDNNKFLYSLSRIMMRVGLPEPQASDAQKIVDAMLKVEAEMPNGSDLVAELKTVVAAR